MQKQYPDSYLGEDEMADVRKHMIFHGRVQGVGFRYTAKISGKINESDRMGEK